MLDLSQQIPHKMLKTFLWETVMYGSFPRPKYSANYIWAPAPDIPKSPDNRVGADAHIRPFKNHSVYCFVILSNLLRRIFALKRAQTLFLRCAGVTFGAKVTKTWGLRFPHTPKRGICTVLPYKQRRYCSHPFATRTSVMCMSAYSYFILGEALRPLRSTSPAWGMMPTSALNNHLIKILA